MGTKSPKKNETPKNQLDSPRGEEYKPPPLATERQRESADDLDGDGKSSRTGSLKTG